MSAPSFPCGPIADRLREHGLVPFLGSAASFVGASPTTALPDGAKLATELLTGIDYPGTSGDSLTKVAQFLEEGPADRPYLLRRISRRFSDELTNDYRSSFMEFLTTLPAILLPRLILTTNYDVLVERALHQRGTPYIAMSRITRGNRYAGRWVTYSDASEPIAETNIVTKDDLEERLKSDQLSGAGAQSVWVLKIHGTAKIALGEDLIDSIVVTEGDYIDQLSTDILKSLPAPAVSILRRSSILFLGYALEDWNFRVLLKRIRQLQTQTDENAPRHWAFLRNPEPVEAQFWKLRGVNMYDLSLDECLRTLAAYLLKS